MSKEKKIYVEKQTKAKTASEGINYIRAQAITEAINEGKISAKDLLTEIQPLMREYFHGKFTVAGQWMIMSMLNGQKFLLNIKEVA